MTRKCFVLVALIALLALPALAQKAEFFGGYQYTRFPGLNANGWNAAATYNFSNWMGVTADFSGAYGSGLKFHTYTFGPVLAPLKGESPINPFVHFLVGGASASAGGVSTNGFDMMVGGGIDAGTKHGFALRLVQADWMLTRFSGITEKNNARISSGIVFRF